MSKVRPYVMTIAGFDPSGGAGVLADIKSFEAHKLYGLALNTGITLQSDHKFYSVEWRSVEELLMHINTLAIDFPISGFKIGIVPSYDFLKKLLLALRQHAPKAIIVWDPVFSSSTGFSFLNEKFNDEIWNHVDWVTPNEFEFQRLFSSEDQALDISKRVNIVRKGGHREDQYAVDYLYVKAQVYKIKPRQIAKYQKHGSGCVFSSALLSNLVLKHPPIKAVLKTKAYVTSILNSNQGLLAYHKL